MSADMSARVIELSRSGMSAADIAREVYITRNAALGYIHRARGRGELPPSNKAERDFANRARSVAVRRVRAEKRPDKDLAVTLKPAQAKTDPTPHGEDELRTDLLTFAELGPHQCRFPVGHGRSMRFCGRHADGTYCPGHHARAYRVLP